MTTALPAPVVPASPAPDDISLRAKIGELYTILKLINDDRARYGVPPLKWDDQLAQHAQEWVDQLAKMGRMEHAPRDGRGVERENLAQGMPWWSVERLVQEWRGEEGNYVPGSFPNVARDGHWEKVAHWTQDISRLSLEIGCAIAKGSGFLWLDCRFSPGGNKDGEQFGPAVEIDQPKLATSEVVGKNAEVEQDRKLQQNLSESLAAIPHDLDCGHDREATQMCEMYRKLKGGGPTPPPPPDLKLPPLPPMPVPPPPGGNNDGKDSAIEQQHWPDFVGNVRIDQGWGSQAIMAAVHTINSPPPTVSYEPATIYVDTNVEPPALPFSDDLLPREALTPEPM